MIDGRILTKFKLSLDEKVLRIGVAAGWLLDGISSLNITIAACFNEAAITLDTSEQPPPDRNNNILP